MFLINFKSRKETIFLVRFTFTVHKTLCKKMRLHFFITVTCCFLHISPVESNEELPLFWFALPKAASDTEDVVHSAAPCFGSFDPTGIHLRTVLESVEVTITAAKRSAA